MNRTVSLETHFHHRNSSQEPFQKPGSKCSSRAILQKGPCLGIVRSKSPGTIQMKPAALNVADCSDTVHPFTHVVFLKTC